MRAGADRPAGRDRRRGRAQGVLGRRAAARRDPQHRRRTSRCSWAATTGRSRASAPAPPAGSRAWPTWRRASAIELFRLCTEGRLDEARAVYARILPLCRLDMHPKLVQFFKAAMDLVGREGGPMPAAAAGADDGRAAPGRGGGGGARGRGRAGERQPRLRGRRLPHGGHAHARDHGRRGPDPGRDDARAQAALRAAHGRPAAAADARAARPRRDVRRDPAAAAAARTRTGACVFIEVSGCLPMCGHGTIGVATVLVETGMVTVRRAGDRGAARHARRPGRGARGGRGRPGALGRAAQRPVVPARPRPRGPGERRHAHLRHGLRRQLLRDPARRSRRGWRWTRPAAAS